MAESRKVLVHIQSSAEGQEVSQQATGMLYVKPNLIFVRYNEAAEGMGQTATTLKIEPNSLKVIRHGDVSSHQTFVPGSRQSGFYETPQGLLELGMYTHRLEVDLNNGIGTVSWSYDLYVTGERAGTYKLDMSIREELES